MSKQSKFYADSESANGIVLTCAETHEKKFSRNGKKKIFLENFCKKKFF